MNGGIRVLGFGPRCLVQARVVCAFYGFIGDWFAFSFGSRVMIQSVLVPDVAISIRVRVMVREVFWVRFGLDHTSVEIVFRVCAEFRV